MKKLIYPIILITSLAGAAASQLPQALQLPQSSQARLAVRPTYAGAPATTVDAAKTFFTEIELYSVQNNPGACSVEPDKCRANIFVLGGYSEPFSVVLTISIDANAAGGVLDRNNPAKGIWVMAVSRAGRYLGTLHGDLQGGKMRLAYDIFTGAETGRSLSGGLRILGGRDGYSGVEPNEIPTMRFSAFTKPSEGMLHYTEARLVKNADPE